MFNDKWISYSGPFHLPASSPGLTPLDIFSSVCVINIVYASQITTEQDILKRMPGNLITYRLTKLEQRQGGTE